MYEVRIAKSVIASKIVVGGGQRQVQGVAATDGCKHISFWSNENEDVWELYPKMHKANAFLKE